MNKVDLNCDMGESFGVYRIGMDAEVIGYVSSANIACGFHAGDPMIMDRTVKLALDHGAGVGAHPGFPDLMGFGRRHMDCTPGEVEAYLTYQVGALQAFCARHGARLQHVKPHGSLYHRVMGDEAMARAVARAIAGVDRSLLWVALAGERSSLLKRIGREEGIGVVLEAFPDRAYTPDGTLVSRRLPGAVIHDPAVASERALRMVKEGRVIAVDGSSVSMEVNTLCVHGDNPAAVELAKTLRGRLEEEDIAVVPMGEFCRSGVFRP